RRARGGATSRRKSPDGHCRLEEHVMTVVRILSRAIAAVAIAATATAPLAAQQRSGAQAPAAQNPLLSPSPLPFHAPPFDKIKDADFQPAIEQGITQQRAEIRR